MQCHEIDYEIIGEGLQFAEIELDPGETVIAEAGAMVFMEDGISNEVKMGDGSSPDSGLMGKLLSAGKRMMTGESVFLTHFTNRGDDKKRIGFAGNFPGSVVAVDLAKVGGSLICQKDAFLCAAYGTELTVEFARRFGAGFFGGEGFILQKARGDGKFLLHVGGQVIKKTLNNETLRVDAGCVVAFTEGIEYGIERAGNAASMVLGGEGLFFATLRGTGTVLIQSVPISKMAATLAVHSTGGGSEKSNGNLSSFLDR